ncbi:calcium/calmodulin-dependent protein kinase type IV isoform X2 [Nilaparvata lugens]|uniref:calcium/calmodulin-dependent protein kinase type IV isoform X1 n=2 Tax=Nilaparvata lugens TaxID=108931 RepID=UPI00193E710B|nr:calcium/calmodulin-dependent protein kinase type IV isoform X1 [Nilaparvata lugens]XP_039275517.1 calcium/calmodulin-dependent protein kinase type IV isoform X2 [Nilaparvata lugens]
MSSSCSRRCCSRSRSRSTCRNTLNTRMDSENWRWFPEARNLEDTYILGDIIARGSYSDVHKCLFKGKAERICKIYKKEHLDCRSVKTQAIVLLKLSHPNMVQIRDVFETEQEVQLVCDWLTGVELFERIVECGNYTELEAAKAIREILSALQYIHSRGLTHGAVRPENLLYASCSSNAQLKLSNIPLAKKRHQPKLIYAAPELFKLKQLTPAADMWSIGILLYILLCGMEPSFSPNEDDADDQKLESDAVWWEDTSESARDLFDCCVRHCPDDRISAEDALAHPWITGQTAKTLPLASTQVRLREFNARRKFKAATQAVLAAQKAMTLISPQRRTAASR